MSTNSQKDCTKAFQDVFNYQITTNDETEFLATPTMDPFESKYLFK